MECQITPAIEHGLGRVQSTGGNAKLCSDVIFPDAQVHRPGAGPDDLRYDMDNETLKWKLEIDMETERTGTKQELVIGNAVKSQGNQKDNGKKEHVETETSATCACGQRWTRVDVGDL